MTRTNQYKKDFVLLLELGFIATNLADENSAIKLFDAAQVLDPQSTLPKVGKGYIHLHKLELSKAIAVFEKVIKEEPENDMAKTFLGLCFSMAPDREKEGEKILKKTMHSEDPLIKKLSHSSLDFVEKFVKKEPTPAEIKKK